MSRKFVAAVISYKIEIRAVYWIIEDVFKSLYGSDLSPVIVPLRIRKCQQTDYPPKTRPLPG
jgi:hypothetical protein